MMRGATIVIAAWQAERTIEAAVRSCLASTGVEVEVIVVDDCSTDGTADIARRLAAEYPSVIYARLDRNSGPSAARNHGLSLASKDWIGIVDSDDEITPTRLAGMLDAAHENGADVILDDMIVVENGTRRPFMTRPIKAVFDLAFYAENNLSYATKTPLGYLKPLFRRAFLESHKIAYDETLFNSEDYLIIMECLARGGRVVFHPIAGYIYYIHGSSISAVFKHDQNAAFITAERGFLRRNAAALDDRARTAIGRHLYYREMSPHLFAVIQALKKGDTAAIVGTMAKLSLRQKLTVVRIVGGIVLRKPFTKTTRV